MSLPSNVHTNAVSVFNIKLFTLKFRISRQEEGQVQAIEYLCFFCDRKFCRFDGLVVEFRCFVLKGTAVLC